MTKKEILSAIKKSIKIAGLWANKLPVDSTDFEFRVVSCKFNGGGQNDFYFNPQQRFIRIVRKGSGEETGFKIRDDVDFYADATDTLAGWLYDTQCIVKQFVWLGE